MYIVRVRKIQYWTFFAFNFHFWHLKSKEFFQMRNEQVQNENKTKTKHVKIHFSMALIHQLKMVRDDWKEWRSKCERQIICFFLLFSSKSKRKKRKNIKILKHMRRKMKTKHSTTEILKYVFTTNSFGSACWYVCGSSHWTATGTGECVYASIYKTIIMPVWCK